MARVSTRQFSFANGEVGPDNWGRADMQFYFASLAFCENMIMDQVGVLHRRPPTTLDITTPDIPYFYDFQTADNRAVLIIAQPTHFLFLVDGGIVQDGGSDFQLAHNYGADYSDLRVEEDLNVAYISHPNHYDQTIDVDGALFTLTTLGAFPFADLNKDQACKLRLGIGGSGGGLMAFVSPVDVAPGTVLDIRKSVSDPAFTATVDENLGADLCSVTLSISQETGDFELDTSGVGDFSTVDTVSLQVESATIDALGCAPFTADMIGQNIRLLDEDGLSETGAEKNTWLVLPVLDVVSATEAVVAYGGNAITATDLFQLPLLVGALRTRANHIADDRLWLGVDNIVIGSEVTDFLAYKPTDELGNVNPDNAIKRKFVSKVNWIASMGRQIVVGTARQVYSLLGAGVSGAFAADGTAQQKNDRISCADRRPAEVAEGVAFIDASRRKLYRTEFSGQYDQVRAVDQSIFVHHFGAERFSKITYQESPFSIVWAATDTGRLLSHTVWPGQDVKGWSRHRLGGRRVVDGVDAPPAVNDLQSIQGDTGDICYLSVERTVVGSPLYTVEHMEGRFDEGDAFENSSYLDCSLPVSSPVGGAISFVSGPVVNGVALPDGAYSATDGKVWVPFVVAAGVATAEAPNTTKEPVPGRDFVTRDGAWERLTAAPEGGDAEFSPSTEDVFRPPVGVTEIRAELSTATGLDYAEGELISVHVDGQWRQETVTGGQVPIGGCVARAGFAYDSIFAFLPSRVNLGATDGANDPIKVIEGAALLRNAVSFECGSGRRSDYHEEAFSYEPAEFEQTGLVAPEGFSGWVTLRPFGELSDNDESITSCRIRGPWPCSVASVELTLDIQGGR